MLASGGQYRHDAAMKNQKTLMAVLMAALMPLLFHAGQAISADMNDPLDQRLVPEVVSALFPEAAGLGPLDTDPPVAPVLDQDGKTIGYLFSTHETVQPAGYSGASFDIMLALGVDGVLRSHILLEEHEPLISKDMIPPEYFSKFLNVLDGIRLSSNMRAPTGGLDGVAGATISAMTMRRAMLNSILKIGRIKGMINETGEALTLDSFGFAERDWPALMEENAIAHMQITAGQVRHILSTEQALADAEIDELPADDAAPIIDLYVALATPPTVGRNLFGARAFRQATSAARPGEHQIFIGSKGLYRWIPKSPYRIDIFERVRIVQGDKTIDLRTQNHSRSRRLNIKRAPKFENAARFRLPPSTKLNPIEPWTLELMIGEEAFPLEYRVPAQFVIGSVVAKEDAGLIPVEMVALGMLRKSTLEDWQLRWVENAPNIIALLALLTAVTATIVFQHRLSRFRRAHRVVRTSLLIVTLGWLGWWTGNQLSILTVMNYGHLAVTGGSWQSLLFDPLMVILSIYTLATLLLWGRGVFCGWLCPFGALQELLNQVARLARLPQLTVPETIQERLWAVKYIVLAVLGAAAINSLQTATAVAEVEPFKTAISVHFQRSWPYVLYAGSLLLVGLFVERAFCRFLCPLGALLALAGRVHVLEWLARRPQCGNPCQICRGSCPVGAIETSGKINMTECFQCLDCQVDYFDATVCPPLVSRRKRLASLAAAPA